jgi:hypothetical protein
MQDSAFISLRLFKLTYFPISVNTKGNPAAMKNQGVIGGGVSGQEVVGMRRAREKGTRDRRSMEWDRNRSLGCQGG